jgi:AcrR family transcriptional regulator
MVDYQPQTKPHQTRTPRKPLSRQMIMAAAVLLVDSEGMEALNMRRLGRELGVVGMTLYRYLPSKEALLHDLVQTMLEEISAGEAKGRNWQQHLRAVMHSYRNVGLAHPHIFLLSLSRPWQGVATARLEEDRKMLTDAGFSESEARHALRTLTSYTTGFVNRSVTRLLFNAETPSAGPIEDPEEDDAFEFGIEAILAGLAVKLER